MCRLLARIEPRLKGRMLLPPRRQTAAIMARATATGETMTVTDTREKTPTTASKPEFSAAEIGALAHLYRGEVYRSTVWRTRLDSSTNWAVVTTGIALSATYSNAEASPLPWCWSACW